MVYHHICIEQTPLPHASHTKLFKNMRSKFHFTLRLLLHRRLFLLLRLFVGFRALLLQGAQLLVRLLDGNELGLGRLLLLWAPLHLVRMVDLCTKSCMHFSEPGPENSPLTALYILPLSPLERLPWQGRAPARRSSLQTDQGCPQAGSRCSRNHWSAFAAREASVSFRIPEKQEGTTLYYIISMALSWS